MKQATDTTEAPECETPGCPEATTTNSWWCSNCQRELDRDNEAEEDADADWLHGEDDE